MANKKSGLTLQYVDIKKIKPHPQNARLHSPEQIAAIAKGLKENGWVRPLMTNEHFVLLAGHGTLKAAKQNGDKEVPVIVRTGLNEAQQRAYVLADNALAERSTWDKTLLGAEVIDLQALGIDLQLTGFDAQALARLLAPPPPPESEPPIPEPKGPTVSKLGDVWNLGRHRLICGDNEKPETLEALMAGKQAHLVFTDPPYGVSYVARSGKFEMIAGDDLRRGQLEGMLTRALQNMLPHTTKDAAWYVWHASSTREDFAAAMRNCGLVELGYLIWAKPQMVLGWSDYRWAHEPCFYACQQGNKPNYYGDRTDTTIWRAAAVDSQGRTHAAIGTGLTLTLPDGREIYIAAAPPKGKKTRHLRLERDEPVYLTTPADVDSLWEVGRDNGHGKQGSLHPNQKPVELPRRAIKNSTQEGEGVLDIYGGSGSTLIAAEQTNRTAYLAELDPGNVDIIVRRWQDFTKREATHDTEEKTFDELTTSRTKGTRKARVQADG